MIYDTPIPNDIEVSTVRINGETLQKYIWRDFY